MPAIKKGCRRSEHQASPSPWRLSSHFSFVPFQGGARASQVALLVKNPPANAGDLQEMWVRSLGQKDPLKEETATHSSILTWESHGQTSLVGYSPQGHKEADTTEQGEATVLISFPVD